mgnify:CR=1 FL=1
MYALLHKYDVLYALYKDLIKGVSLQYFSNGLIEM